jgi:hypothetical protein
MNNLTSNTRYFLFRCIRDTSHEGSRKPIDVRHFRSTFQVIKRALQFPHSTSYQFNWSPTVIIIVSFLKTSLNRYIIPCGKTQSNNSKKWFPRPLKTKLCKYLVHTDTNPRNLWCGRGNWSSSKRHTLRVVEDVPGVDSTFDLL